MRGDNGMHSNTYMAIDAYYTRTYLELYPTKVHLCIGTAQDQP